jgi:hypothetical protein
MDRVGYAVDSEPPHFSRVADNSATDVAVQPDLGASATDARRIEGALERHFSVKEIADLWVFARTPSVRCLRVKLVSFVSSDPKPAGSVPTRH